MRGTKRCQLLTTRGQTSIDSSGHALAIGPTISIVLAQQVHKPSMQRRRRAVEALATIDVLDLDDPATVPPDGVDEMDPVTPVANESAFDELRHGPHLP